MTTLQLGDYIFTIYFEGHIEEENGYVETSISDLTIDEFKYLKTCHSDNLGIYKTETGYVIILKNIDITISPILYSICRKAKRKVDNNFCDLCKFELQRCTRGTLKQTEEGIIFITKQQDNKDKIMTRQLSYFEKTMLSEKFIINNKLELVVLNDSNNVTEERDYLYYAFFDRIYSNNITTLSYLINAYETDSIELDKIILLNKIKYLISISDPFELQKIHGINGYSNPCICGYDKKTNNINELIKCMISPYSNLGKPFDLCPIKTIVYETTVRSGQFAGRYECYIDSGMKSTKNMFYIAIMNNDIKFILDCINLYVNSLDMLCLSKLCGNKVIHNLIYNGSNKEYLQNNKYYEFYKKINIINKPYIKYK
jgi:hypothetical protein